MHDLLFCHDCVIVPQWGGFLTHYRGARLDEARRTIQPPGKDLSFNRHLVRNDGLLADHLAKREGIGFDVATARIDAEVSNWHEALDRTGRLELQHIGIFFRDAEHNLQFDPDKRANYLKDAFGLRPLAAVPVERSKPAPVIRTIEPQPSVQPVARSRTYWAAAAIGAVLLGSAAFWAYQLGGHNSEQWSSLAGFGKRTPPNYVAPVQSSEASVFTAPHFTLPETTGITTVPLTPDDSVTVTVDLGLPSVVAPVDSTSVVVKQTPPAKSEGRYHVVGGCFAQPENADKLLGELIAKGYPARRLSQRGRLHPVVYGSYATKAQAVEAMASVRNNGGQAAWLLIR
ncbi:MAG TPA: SPOR domain-containing protein [Flavobacteriales bacterium]|nr:SPOR domain-containing protein [Flavobacteriales bacterium]